MKLEAIDGKWKIGYLRDAMSVELLGGVDFLPINFLEKIQYQISPHPLQNTSQKISPERSSLEFSTPTKKNHKKDNNCIVISWTKNILITTFSHHFSDSFEFLEGNSTQK
jgi:hypothetical protein